VASGNPARVGGWYTLWLTGLGEIGPRGPLQSGFLILDGTGHGSWVYAVSWDSAGVSGGAFVGRSPQFAGVYQINFQVPSGLLGDGRTYPVLPYGSYSLEMAMKMNAIAGPARAYCDSGRSNVTFLPVRISPGDGPCAAPE